MINPIVKLRKLLDEFDTTYDKQSFDEVELECYRRNAELPDDTIWIHEEIQMVCKAIGYELWVKNGKYQFYKDIPRQTFDLPYMLLEEGDVITFSTDTGVSYKYTVFATNYVDGRLKVTVE